MPVHVEGYPPPYDPRLEVLKVTPDPGVIEVNVQPAPSWREAVDITPALYEDARPGPARRRQVHGRRPPHRHRRRQPCRGRRRDAADSPVPAPPGSAEEPGALLAAPSVAVVPVLRPVHRPDQPGAAHRRGAARQRSTSWRSRWRRCPPPASEQRRRRGWSTGCSATSWSTSPATPTAPKSASTSSIRPTARPAGSGWSNSARFEMPPDARMSLAQQLLMRALIAWFWREPQRRRARALGHGAARPLHAAAFRLGGLPRRARRPARRRLRLRSGLVRGAASSSASRSSAASSMAASRWKCGRRWSPGTCWARRARPAAPCAMSTPRSSACRSRPTASSPGATSSPATAARVPMTPTGAPGEAVGGVRFKAWQPASGLHPTIPVARAADLRHRRHAGTAARSAAASITSPIPAAATTTPSRSIPTRRRRAGWRASRTIGHTPGPVRRAARASHARVPADARPAAPPRRGPHERAVSRRAPQRVDAPWRLRGARSAAIGALPGVRDELVDGTGGTARTGSRVLDALAALTAAR